MASASEYVHIVNVLEIAIMIGKHNKNEEEYRTYIFERGNIDLRIVVINSDDTFDQKLRTVFEYIRSSSGDRLYSILDNLNVKNQTVTMDGRTVQIYVIDYEIIVDFGSIIK